ncbi:MAG: YCF48-related protein, partial [Chloroflexota bacterium]
SVFFPDNTFGWAVGAGGVISATTNGGGTWGAQASGTVNNLNSVHATDNSTAWAVGDAGTIINTANGTTWGAQTAVTGNNLYDIFMNSNGNDGWVVGAGGVIETTFNGGAGWATQTSNSINDLNAIFFANTNVGWAVGAGGTILYTANGGTNWTAQNSQTMQSLYDVFAADANTAWAVGDMGTILHTTNGGTTWTAQNSTTTQNLNHIFFTYANRYGGQPYQGTSMATPAVSGIMGLMLEAYNLTYSNNDPWPSTLKAVLMNTATDLGNAGPDYKFGYGHVNALNAVNLIRATTAGTTSTYIRQSNISNGATQVYTVTTTAAVTPQCILVWDDVAGTVGAAKSLVNDLNLRMVDPSNTTHMPWILDPNNQNNLATRGNNSVDNVEQVIPTTAATGNWSVQVTASIPSGTEDYSLVCSHLLTGDTVTQSGISVYLPVIQKN